MHSFCLNSLVQCRTHCENRVFFPVVLSAECFWTKEKYWVFWTLFLEWKIWQIFFFFQWCGVLLLLFFFCCWFECSLMSVRVLCYNNNFGSSLGMRSTMPLCKNSHSTYQYIDLNSPKFQLKSYHTKTLNLACSRPQMAEFFPTAFQGRGGFRGRESLATICCPFIILRDSGGLLGLWQLLELCKALGLLQILQISEKTE